MTVAVTGNVPMADVEADTTDALCTGADHRAPVFAQCCIINAASDTKTSREPSLKCVLAFLLFSAGLWLMVCA